MNDFKICLHNHFIFNSFTVQPGMIFGIDTMGNSIITNGKPSKGGYWAHIGNEDAEFELIHVTPASHPTVYTKIQKALRQRERKNIQGVTYRNSAQLETERWEMDDTKRHYKSACVPIGHTSKSHAIANPEGAARYNSMKERNTLTQRLNTCKYSNGKDCMTVI